jgi:hypothetical protein
MARGWGRSEEDQDAEKELAREAVGAASARLSPEQAAAATSRRALELSLAHLEDQLARTEHPVRREALEAARAELRARLAAVNRRGRE